MAMVQMTHQPNVLASQPARYVGSMVDDCLQCWPIIKPTLGQCIMFAGLGQGG